MFVVGCLIGLTMTQTWLDRILPEDASQDWGQLGVGKSVQGNPLRIGGRMFQHGLGTHANSRIVYDLGSRYRRFQAWVGVDDEMGYRPIASMQFQVFGDGRTLYDSGICKAKEPARRVDVDVSGVRQLVL